MAGAGGAGRGQPAHDHSNERHELRPLRHAPRRAARGIGVAGHGGAAAAGPAPPRSGGPGAVRVPVAGRGGLRAGDGGRRGRWNGARAGHAPPPVDGGEADRDRGVGRGVPRGRADDRPRPGGPPRGPVPPQPVFGSPPNPRSRGVRSRGGGARGVGRVRRRPGPRWGDPHCDPVAIGGGSRRRRGAPWPPFPPAGPPHRGNRALPNRARVCASTSLPPRPAVGDGRPHLRRPLVLPVLSTFLRIPTSNNNATVLAFLT